MQKTTEQKAAGRPARLNYKMKTQLQLYALLAPVLILIFIFCYLPLYGLLIAFQDWYPGMPFLDFTGATKWVGLKHFISFFQNPYFWRLIKNTLVLSALNLGVAFWIPIGFALLINELRLVKFKKFAQTASYLPYFISSVVVAGMALSFLSSDGIINKLIVLLGGEPFLLNMKPQYFPIVYTLINIWRNFGWGSILYLSSMASIDTALYEAASLDGANRWHKMWHITLPSIKPTIVVMLIMGVGGICTSLNVSPLLACMASGPACINASGNKHLFKQLNQFTPPLLVMFFVLSGMRLSIPSLAAAGVIGIVYFLVRIAGKYTGSALGAAVTHASPEIRRYFGLALIPQAGVSIGLAVLGQRMLPAESGQLLSTIILSSGLLYEMVGPACAKASIKLSGSVPGKAAAGKADAGKADAGKASVGKASAGKADAEKAAAGKVIAGSSSASGPDIAKADGVEQPVHKAGAAALEEQTRKKAPDTGNDTNDTVSAQQVRPRHAVV